MFTHVRLLSKEKSVKLKRYLIHQHSSPCSVEIGMGKMTDQRAKPSWDKSVQDTIRPTGIFQGGRVGRSPLRGSAEN